jgi:putative tryptophan/tyrosine transport system substrate-binding protein
MLHCMRPLMMLWTASPPARRCHGRRGVTRFGGLLPIACAARHLLDVVYLITPDALSAHVMPMRRREFIRLLGGAAATWPVAARAQQSDQMRRIGVLQLLADDDPETVARRAAFEHALQALGWTVGRNVRIDYRSAGGADDANSIRKDAAELVALGPDVILTAGSLSVAGVLQVTRTVPIVFSQAVDPVGGGLVESLAHPGGNATGFTSFEYSLSAKWLELLKEIAPHVTRVAVIRDPTRGPGVGQYAVIQSVGQPLGVELRPINAPDRAEIERTIAAFARSSNGGLIVTVGGSGFRRDLIVPLAARHRLPAVYPFRYYVADGGLISYGPNTIDLVRRAADYVDRILKGEKPADMPVQAPTKYELIINLKTARALGLSVPPSLLARADEVIE